MIPSKDSWYNCITSYTSLSFPQLFSTVSNGGRLRDSKSPCSTTEAVPTISRWSLTSCSKGSLELMESGSASSDWWSLVQSFGGDHLGAAKQGDMENGNLKEGISYEQMQAIIEEVLEENG